MTADVDPGDGPAAETLAALIEGDEDRDLTFDAPWQARAFGIAAALRDRDGFDWDAFQSRFIEHVQATDPDRMQADVEGVYYERWLAALEERLVEEGAVDPDDLDARTEAFHEGERDSSEFVRE